MYSSVMACIQQSISKFKKTIKTIRDNEAPPPFPFLQKTITQNIALCVVEQLMSYFSKDSSVACTHE